MNKFLSLMTFALALILFSCNGKNKEADVTYEYVEKVPELSGELKAKIGDWAEEGKVCYGILAVIDGDGIIQEGAVIKAKIVRIKGDSIKMKSLVDLKLREVEGCSKMGISRGETWWETEGDLFLSQEEAEAYLAKELPEVSI